MSDDSSASYYFLPWVRWGAAASIEARLGKKPEPGQTSIPGRAGMPTTLRLTGVTDSGVTAAPELNIPLRLYGPGDVRGIDAREIIRIEPQNLTTDFQPHLFPFIEFDRPDFPWLFTPAGPDEEQCLRPWIVLAVVPKEAAQISAPRPLPVLSCSVKELPDLEESWAWAHAQYIGILPADGRRDQALRQALNGQPDRNVSRLLCARKLAPRQSYYACLVPAFSIQPQEEVIQNAWDVAGDGKVDVPIYYHWEFSTAEEGSFEDLVKRLIESGKDLSTGAPRLMDMSEPFAGVSQTPLEKYQGAKLNIVSALSIDNPQSDPDQFPEFSRFKTKLREILTTQLASVPLPVYGAWHVDGVNPARVLDHSSGAPPWIDDLNLDPRYRMAAAMGTAVVQRDQEALMQSAWEQLAEMQSVNRQRLQMQLGRAVATSIFEKRLKPLSDQALLRVTAPRPYVSDRQAAAQIDTLLVGATVSAPFRRTMRPFSPMIRKLGARTEAQRSTAGSQAARSAAEEHVLMSAVPPPGATAGAVAVSGYPTKAASPALVPSYPDPRARSSALDALNPYKAFNDIASQIAELSGTKLAENGSDLLQTRRVAPSFPRPMYEALREQFRESLIPGLDRVPNPSIIALQPNPAFIEAFMVGLNHEMSREFLWREYPAELGSTYFRRFWPNEGSPSAEDIPPIASWRKPLKDNMDANRGKNLKFLLIRGDLFVRYPNALVYVVPATWGSDDTATPNPDASPEFAQLRIEAVPGITLLGFHVQTETPPQDPGWYFVFEEHPTETRFGLDREFSGQPGSWRDLAWNHVALRGDSGYLKLSTKPTQEDLSSAKWSKNSAHMAYITLRKTFRLVVHKRYWFP